MTPTDPLRPSGHGAPGPAGHHHDDHLYADDPLQLPWIPRGAEMDEIKRIASTIRGEA